MTLVRIILFALFLCNNSFMLLVIDIGNTNTNIGIFKENTLIKKYAVASDINKTSDEYGIIISSLLLLNSMKDEIKSAIIASVVPVLEETIKEGIKNYLDIEPYVVSYKSKLPVTLAIQEPKEAGADRIANASGAVRLYKPPIIVIDIGTATTFDIIDENKNFIGGIIAPGPYIQAKSLSKFTSKLPKLKIEEAKNAIGKNTIDAMLSGIVFGHKKMIEGMIEECEKELGKKATIISTGGYSDILFNGMKRKFDYINKDLTLFGIKVIWELNAGGKI